MDILHTMSIVKQTCAAANSWIELLTRCSTVVSIQAFNSRQQQRLIGYIDAYLWSMVSCCVGIKPNNVTKPWSLAGKSLGALFIFICKTQMKHLPCALSLGDTGSVVYAHHCLSTVSACCTCTNCWLVSVVMSQTNGRSARRESVGQASEWVHLRWRSGESPLCSAVSKVGLSHDRVRAVPRYRTEWYDVLKHRSWVFKHFIAASDGGVELARISARISK